MMRRTTYRVAATAIAAVVLLFVGGCNDLQMFEQIVEVRLDQDDPIIPGWMDGFPTVTVNQTTLNIGVKLEEQATVYYGVWPSEVVSADPASDGYREDALTVYTNIEAWAGSEETSDPQQLLSSAVQVGAADYPQNLADTETSHEIVVYCPDENTDYTVVLLAVGNDGPQTFRGMWVESVTTAGEPIVPAWSADYPTAVPADRSIELTFGLEQLGEIFYGVWPADAVPSDPADPDYEAATTEIYDNIVLWSDGRIESGSLGESWVGNGVVTCDAGATVVETVTGLDPEADYTVVAVAGVPDADLQAKRGMWVEGVLTTALATFDPEVVDHFTLHISEPAILNGNTARFVIRAEDADGLVIPDAAGVVEVEPSAAGTTLSIDGTALQDNRAMVEVTAGMAYLDVEVTNTVSGGVQDVEFTATSGSMSANADTVRVVDVTGFAELGQTTVFTNGVVDKFVVSGSLERIAAAGDIVMDQGDMLVLLPGSHLWFSGTIFDAQDSSIYLLGTAAEPVELSGPSVDRSNWMGIELYGFEVGSHARFVANGARIAAPDANPLLWGGMGDLDMSIEIANSRIAFNNEVSTAKLISLFDAALGYSRSLTVENTVIHSDVLIGGISPGIVFHVDTGGAAPRGTTEITIDHSTVTAVNQDENYWNPLLDDMSTGSTGWFITSSIMGGYYEPIGMVNMGTVATVSRCVWKYDGLTAGEADGWDGGTATLDDVLLNPNGVNTYWPGYWGAGPGETFELQSDNTQPSTVPSGSESMVGSLTAGHPNEVGAYANFGYPPPGQ